MSNSISIKLVLKDDQLSQEEFKKWLNLIPKLSSQQFDILCNEVFAETMEREQLDIMDPPSFDDELPF